MEKNGAYSQLPEPEAAADALSLSAIESHERAGTLIRLLRERKKMSGEELGKHVGFSRASIGHW
jgi:hypothetical protein